MSETLEFPCPNCHTDLRVPIQMAGISGPCPHCQASITSPSAPHPAPAAPPQPTPKPEDSKAVDPQPAPKQTPQKPPSKNDQRKPPSSDYDRERYRKGRPLWPSIILPTLVLAFAAAAVYLILNAMGLIGPKAGDPAPTETTSTVSDKTTTPDRKPVQPGKPVAEAPKPSPPIEVLPSPAPPAEAAENPKPTPVPAKPEPLEILRPAETAEPAITPEDINKPGEVPADLPEVTTIPGSRFSAPGLQGTAR